MTFSSRGVSVFSTDDVCSLQVEVDDRVGRRDDSLVLDEIAEMRIFLFADRSLERNRLLRDLQDLAHLGHRNVHALGDFFAGRLAPKFLHELAAGAHQLVDRLDHVHRNANRAGLIGDRAGDGLANPPGRVGREFVAAAPLELIDRLHQADIAFLNQVEKLQAAVGVFLGDGNDQAQVGLDQFLLGLLGFRFAAKNDLSVRFRSVRPTSLASSISLSFGAARAQFLARFGGVIALGDVGAALQFPGFALERLQALDGVAHLVDQPLFLERVELDGANQRRHLDARARHVPLRA